jgi:hypothetical protein
MSEINYLKGDATSPQAKGNKIIAHICNDNRRMGKRICFSNIKKMETTRKRVVYK